MLKKMSLVQSEVVHVELSIMLGKPGRGQLYLTGGQLCPIMVQFVITYPCTLGMHVANVARFD